MNTEYPVVQRRSMPTPSASIGEGSGNDTDRTDLETETETETETEVESIENPESDNLHEALKKLHGFLTVGGDISELLEPAEVSKIGKNAVEEWRYDLGSIDKWRNMAEKGIALASQDFDDDGEATFPWPEASDIHYPILTTAANQWAARAYPELIRGDKAVSVKVFTPQPKEPGAAILASIFPPQTPEEQALVQQQAQQEQQQAAIQSIMDHKRQLRGQRVADFMNWLLFSSTSMSGWESDTDLLLHQLPVVGSGFKKVYMGDKGICSDYVSPLHLTVHNDTKSMYTCPRITHDFDLYPYQLDEAMRSGRYREVDLTKIGDDDQSPRQIIEQLRLEDLDGDGLNEPYLVTVDVESNEVLRIEPAFGFTDIKISEKTGKIIRIERYNPYPDFKFLPDPKGGFYATGLAKLLEPITDAIDSNFNQLMDAGTAQIAGGGFVSAQVRIQGSASGGTTYFSPGEYKTVQSQGALSDMFYERTLPQPSDVSLKVLMMLMEAAKDISSVKDVLTGDGNNMAAVGTTLAMQNQALQVFSSIYKRVYRGFREEFRLMYQCLQKFGTDRERQQYEELTGGNFDEDFTGDGTDIQPVGDPSVVTKMQKMSRTQAMIQLAESEIGQAAGMTQAGPAKAMVLEALDILDVDRPDRFVADVQPDPVVMAGAQAKVQAEQAKAVKTAADAKHIEAKTKHAEASAVLELDKVHEKAEELASRPLGQVSPEDAVKIAQAQKLGAEATLAHAKADREIGLAAHDHDVETHDPGII